MEELLISLLSELSRMRALKTKRSIRQVNLVVPDVLHFKDVISLFIYFAQGIIVGYEFCQGLIWVVLGPA